jgi:hypothetical protein
MEPLKTTYYDVYHSGQASNYCADLTAATASLKSTLQYLGKPDGYLWADVTSPQYHKPQSLHIPSFDSSFRYFR